MRDPRKHRRVNHPCLKRDMIHLFLAVFTQKECMRYMLVPTHTIFSVQLNAMSKVRRQLGDCPDGPILNCVAPTVEIDLWHQLTKQQRGVKMARAQLREDWEKARLSSQLEDKTSQPQVTWKGLHYCCCHVFYIMPRPLLPLKCNNCFLVKSGCLQQFSFLSV